MSKYIGVDWASKGWFGIILDDEGWDADLFPSVWSLWKYHSDATRIAIDIPIGLPVDDRRECDVAAKRQLQERHGSVFYTPIRSAVYQPNLEAAKATNETAGYSIQNQTWSIVPRIREVDEFLDMYPSARDRLYETHPELCFYGMNDQRPVASSKRTTAGIERRTAILADEHPTARSIVDTCVDRYTTPGYAPMVSGTDDIVDAVAAALTARRPSRKLASLPKGNSPPRDERGLPMQIIYPGDVNQTTLSGLEARSPG